MKIVLNADVYGWRMTGLIGKNGAWFFGLSFRPWYASHTYPMPAKAQEAAKVLSEPAQGLELPHNIEAMRLAIAALDPWRPISEAPKDGRPFHSDRNPQPLSNP